MWGPCLHEEVVFLFHEAQRPQQERVQVWLWRRYQTRLAGRRESYDAHRYFRDEWYETQLETHRESSRLRVANRVPTYVAWQKEKARRNAAARAKRLAGRMCPECGKPVPMRSAYGTTPKYCSKLCNGRAARRAWWEQGAADVEATRQIFRESRAITRAQAHIGQVRRNVSAAGRFFITPHAVRRYQERTPSAARDFDRALGELIRMCERAHFVKRIGDFELWRTGKPERLRLRVMRGNAGLPQIVTVMRGHDQM